MKLYTEEQVINTVNAIQIYIEKFGKDDAQPTIKNHLKMLGPIELPSDEEIEAKSNFYYPTKKIAGYMSEEDFVQYAKKESFVEGAKWLKEQILNQNK